MSCYAPRMSQALKDHIWAQGLGLGFKVTRPNKYMTSIKQFGGNM
jgi:hypothetical protein